MRLLSHLSRRRQICLPLMLIIMLIAAMIVPGNISQAQSAGTFTQRGFSVRGIGMGNALVADAFGTASPWYNPSLAPRYSDQAIEVSYTFLSHDRRLEYLQFVVPMKPRAGVVVGLIHAGVANIDGRDASGYHTETYSTDEFAAFLGFGSFIGSRMTVGLAFRFYRSDLFNDLSAATGLGLQFATTIEIIDDLFIAASLDDVLAKFKWDSSDIAGNSGRTTLDKFPIKLRFGVGYRLLNERLVLLGEYESRFESVRAATSSVSIAGGSPRVVTSTEDLTLLGSTLRIGGEYRVIEMLWLRLGLDRIASGEAGEMIPTGGFALEFAVGELGTRFDYTFGKEAFGLGTFHLIGVHFAI